MSSAAAARSTSGCGMQALHTMNVAAKSLRSRSDRKLFVAAGPAILAVVFAGFARTYFLRGLFFRDALPLLLLVHGAVMFAWFALFFVQTCLIERHRVTLHRKLGAFGAVLAAAMLVIGPYVAFRAAAREVHADAEDAGLFLAILGYDCVIITLFAGFVACAIAWRGRGDYHKRLMLLATLSLLTPAIARLPLRDNLAVILLGDLCVVACVTADAWLHRRLHPVFIVGAPLILAATWLAYVGAGTRTWMNFARMLVA